jgi:5-oxoprolinase (ATP-hydrolysing) subunit A
MGARVWLNIDLGETPDEPEALYACAHVANVACGGHAGDESSMRRAALLCALHGAALGAHPSYPDREGFGRRPMRIAPAELRRSVREQCARLATIAGAGAGAGRGSGRAPRDEIGRTPAGIDAGAGASIAFVKPHGALYHAAHDDAATAEALVLGAIEGLGAGLTIVGPPRGALAEAAARAGVAFAREGFADRATRADGTLVPRGEPGALVLDPAAAADRARALAASGEVDTICVHGDTPGAVDLARAVRAALDSLSGADR